MPLEIFPYYLARITGLPMDYLDGLRNDRVQKLAGKMLEEEVRFYKEKEELQAALLKIIADHPDVQAKNSLANLVKDIQQQRRIHPQKYQKLLPPGPKSQSFFLRLEQYERDLRDLPEKVEKFDREYQAAISESRSKLQRILAHPALLKGLPLASISIHHRIIDFLAKPIALHKKKERQTERSALQFLTRVATKTSPFSTFTSLGLQRFSDRQIKAEPEHFVRLNNYLLSYLQEKLEAIPAFIDRVPLRINPGLRSKENNWHFILNTGNVETIQQMDYNPLVSFILELLNESRKNLLELTAILCDKVAADQQQLRDFIRQLIDLGLLEWEWGLSGAQHDWADRMMKQLNGSPEFAERKSILETLSFLKAQTVELARADHLKRSTILQETFARLQLFFGDNEQDNAFLLKREKLFYEDHKVHLPVSIRREEVFRFVQIIDRLMVLLAPFTDPGIRQEVDAHFNNLFAAPDKIGVLEFYDSFFRQGDSLPKEDPDIEALLEKLKPFLSQHATGQSSGVIALQSEKLEGVLSVDPSMEYQGEIASGRAAFFHFYKEPNQALSAYLEANFMGFGKMMGRFLHCFPGEVTKDLYRWNTEMVPEEMWIENVDASYFNANLHPPLLAYEIESPGSQNSLPVQQLVGVKDLEIVREAPGSPLFLRHRPSNNKVHIFNFGFEALESRSSMYQLLQSFGYQVPSLDILSQLIDVLVLKELSPEVWFLPRIIIDECLVLKRKRWFFLAENLPTLKNTPTSESEFYLAVQRWRECWQLPEKMFLTLEPLDLPRILEDQETRPNRKTDHYKPQFIDFTNPLLVQLFARLLRKTQGWILLEEMLPANGSGLHPENKGMEVLIEWKNIPIK